MDRDFTSTEGTVFKVRLFHHGTGSLEEVRETVLSALLILFNSYNSPSYKGRKHRGRE